MSALPRYCPNCGYDYESWIEICPDCGVLVKSRDDKGERPHLEAPNGGFEDDEDPHWTVVSNMPNAIIGGLVKSQLEDAGIPVLMMRAPSAAVAEFSGNDFVPHVLLVPRKRLVEARALIDSAPDNAPSGPYWDDAYSHDEDDDWYGDSEPASDLTDLRRLWGADPANSTDSKPNRILPEGWNLLPTESDVRSRTEQKRSRDDTQSASTQSWYWQGSTAPATQPDESAPIQEDAPYRPDSRSRARMYEDDLAEYNRDDAQWTGPSKWIRIFYGILLLAMSLPFILQLLGELTNIFK